MHLDKPKSVEGQNNGGRGMGAKFSTLIAATAIASAYILGSADTGHSIHHSGNPSPGASIDSELEVSSTGRVYTITQRQGGRKSLTIVTEGPKLMCINGLDSFPQPTSGKGYETNGYGYEYNDTLLSGKWKGLTVGAGEGGDLIIKQPGTNAQVVGIFSGNNFTIHSKSARGILEYLVAMKDCIDGSK